MRNAPPRSSPFGTLLLIAGLLCLGVGGTLGVLVYLGKIELWGRARAEYVPVAGTAAVYLTVTEIPAYTKITREHLLNQGNPAVAYLSHEEIASRGFFTEPSKIIGRVVAHDMKPGVAFREADLLPEGTRPGPVAGIPPGKRALVLEASKINGVHALKAGDHFDLLATVLVEPAKTQGHGPIVVVGSSAKEPKKHAAVKPLVQNGVVVLAVATRPPVAGMPKKHQDKEKPVPEIVIAVSPDEIAPLTEALAVGAEITAAYRSGQPENSVQFAALTPGSPPPPKTNSVEVIHNGKRETLIFPSDGGPPVVQPEAATATSASNVVPSTADKTPAPR